jgi:hypothetical protein
MSRRNRRRSIPGRVGGSQFTLEANRIGKFKLTLSARMNGAGRPRRHRGARNRSHSQRPRAEQVFNGRLENSVQHELNFPATAIPDASKIFVRLYPGPLSQVIEGMDSILRMPGGCFEQTSSSTYPNVLALDYMKRTKKLTPEVHAKAEGYIANGYQRLLTFRSSRRRLLLVRPGARQQDPDAYGLMEFSDMSKVYDVDPEAHRAHPAVAGRQQQADGSWKPDTSFINEGATNRYNSDVLRITAYIAWSLENTGYQGPRSRRPNSLSSSPHERQDRRLHPGRGRQLRRRLRERRSFKRPRFHSSGHATPARRPHRKRRASLVERRRNRRLRTGESASVETTGLAVQALLKWGEASGTARKAMNYIASKKDASGGVGHTQATIMALRALLLATEKGAADVRGTLQVLLNGKPVEKLTLTPENNDLLHQFVFKGYRA